MSRSVLILNVASIKSNVRRTTQKALALSASLPMQWRDVPRGLFDRVSVCVLAALLLRLAVVAFVYPSFLTPGREHWEFGCEIGQIAKSIATGHGFANPYWVKTGPTAILTPVFPYTVAAIFKLFGVQTKGAAIALLSLNCLISALTCIPIYRLGRKCFDVRAARLAMWGWAVFPHAIYYSAASLWYHTLLGFLITVIVLVAVSLQDRVNGLLRWLCFGGLFGIATLTCPVVLPLFPFLLGWLYIERRCRWLPSATGVFLACIALAAVVTPWFIRNAIVFHQPVFLKDNFWLEMSVGNQGDAVHWWNSAVHPSGNTAELAMFQQDGELRYLASKHRDIVSWIGQHPGRFFFRSVRRVLYFWTGFWSTKRNYLLEEPFAFWDMGLCTSFTSLILLGFAQMRKRSRYFPLFAWIYAAYPVVYYLTFPDLGYRLPIDPIGVLVASFYLTGRAERPTSLRSLVGKEMSVLSTVHVRSMAKRYFVLIIGLLFASPATAQSQLGNEKNLVAPGESDTGLSQSEQQRILGIIPDYQTVRDSQGIAVPPLTAEEKWTLMFRGASDPFNLANVALNSGLASLGRAPQYGKGMIGLSQRFGAGMADLSIQSVASGGVLAYLLHQDPRYFRKGTSTSLATRVGYSVSRIAVARGDSGHDQFNATGVFGMMAGIGMSNLYYPAKNRTAGFMLGRLESTTINNAVGNLVSEFWPDIQRRWFGGKHKRLFQVWRH